MLVSRPASCRTDCCAAALVRNRCARRRARRRVHYAVQASSEAEASLAELQERLDEEVARENYQAAADLRDKIA